VSVAWQHHKERGSHCGLRLMVWIALSLGRAPARTLLYPICLYFLVGFRSARQAIRRFRERAIMCPVSWLELFHHYHVFASTILDRVYFLKSRFDLFEVEFHGREVLDRELAKGHGCILLGAHVGSFEVLRSLGRAHGGLDIRVVMDEQNAHLIRDLTRELNPAVAETVIQVGGIETMLHVKECLDRGGVVGVMGDRVMQDDQTVGCMFLGKEARFPTGPMRLAHVVRAPVVLCVGLYRGGNRYEIHLEPFCNQVLLSADQREAELRRWVQRYADRLEVVCRTAPDNWFNFYEFWGE
jgi:predicted LPLAT superfamily acyltransferase